MNIYESSVEKGIAFLDERFPGWHNEIDVEKLDVMCAGRCVLGQLYGTYAGGLTKLGLTTQKSSECGFNAPDNLHGGKERKEYIYYLTEMWIYKVLVRQGLEKLLEQEPVYV